MGVYSKKAKEKLGNDVWEKIMTNVDEGVINENNMKEIAFSLTNKVGGNQTRRTNFDVHAMSDILSDWYGEELFEMSTEAALKKLHDIFLKPTLRLKILARFLKDKLSVLQLSKDASPPPDPPTTQREEEVPLQRTSKKRRATKHDEDSTMKMTRRNSDSDEREFKRSCQEARKHHEAILDHPYPRRLTLAAWADEIQKGSIRPPTPLTYHRRYLTNQAFLKDSFKGEALPGVFRPSNSSLTEEKAVQKFKKSVGHTPALLTNYSFPQR